MKKCMAILLSVLLLLCSVPLVGADTLAPDAPCFVVSKEEAKAGETVNVTVSAINNPGIVSTKVWVSFDTAVLKLQGCQDGEFGAGYSYTELGLANEKGRLAINWCNTIEPDNTSTWLATLTFEVLTDAAYGPSALNIEFSCEDDVFNYDWETVEFAPVHGEVYVLYPVTGVTLDKTALNLYNGDTAALNATVLADGRTDESLQWASDNTSVLLVDELGNLTAVGLGTATVTVTADGGFTATCVVNVTCGHRQTSAVDALPSTCSKPGHAAYVLCLDCGEIISGSDADLPLAKHTYDDVVTAPDCENSGYTVHTCTVCGHSYVDSRVDAIGHNYQVTKNTLPTCVDAGEKVYTCVNCNDSYTEVVPAHGKHTYEYICDEDCDVCGYVRDDAHHYVFMGTVNPTCGEDGSDGYKCWECGACRYVIIPATGNHKYSGVCDAECNVCGFVRDSVPAHNYVLTDSVELTCVTDGVKTYTCENCGDCYTETISAVGHKYDIVITAPDCENGGYTTHTCTVCGDVCVDNRTDALGHSYNAVVTDPTCGADGYTTHTCKNCGHSYVDSYVSATGDHTYDGYTDKECNGCDHVRLPGDVDDNGRVNNRDLGTLQKHLNGSDVSYNEDATDIDGNGKINNRDLGYLQKLLNNN